MKCLSAPSECGEYYFRKNRLLLGDKICAFFFARLPISVFSSCIVPHAFHDLLWWSFCDWGGGAGDVGGGLSCPSDKRANRRYLSIRVKCFVLRTVVVLFFRWRSFVDRGFFEISSADSSMISGWLAGQISVLVHPERVHNGPDRKTFWPCKQSKPACTCPPQWPPGCTWPNLNWTNTLVLCDTLPLYGVPLAEDWTVWYTSKSSDMEARFVNTSSLTPTWLMNFLNFRSVYNSITAIKWVLHKSQSDKECIDGNKVSHAQATIWQGMNIRILEDNMSGCVINNEKVTPGNFDRAFSVINNRKMMCSKKVSCMKLNFGWCFSVINHRKKWKVAFLHFSKVTHKTLTRSCPFCSLFALVNINEHHESGFEPQSIFVWGAKDTSDLLKLWFDSMKIS